MSLDDPALSDRVRGFISRYGERGPQTPEQQITGSDDLLSPAASLDDRAATAIRYGASGFLLKDTTSDFLRAAIRTVHAGNSVRAPGDLSKLLNGTFRARTPAPAAYEQLNRRGTVCNWNTDSHD